MATVGTTVRERSVGELVNELATEASTLVRQEVHLATNELTQKAAYAGRCSRPILAGGALALVALMTLAGAIVLIVAHVIPLWASALIVSAILGGVAYVFANTGIKAIKRADLRPTETIASLKDNKTWTTNLLH